MLRDPRRQPRSARAAAKRAPDGSARQVPSPSLPPLAVAESRSLRDGLSRRPARGSRRASTRGKGTEFNAIGEKPSDARGRLADRAGDHLDRAPATGRPATRLAVRIRLSMKGHRADEAAIWWVH